MCGIAGFVVFAPAASSDKIIERMTRVIGHRGPDGDGFYRDPLAQLGHRRLSIIDLAAGQQPMTNEAGNLWIVYNGEIFNHADLRPALELAGHHYKTHCDTETILHAYEEYGADCVTRFRGMFSFAIWDRNSSTLFCARDRLGIKPFYYYWDGRLFAFASEIKALLEHPAISPAFEESLLPEYLAFGYSSDDRTFFSGIRKLMPGHTLTLSGEGLRIERYWEIPAAGEVEARDDASWIAECRQRLEETVRMRLMSDVPLGMFLSGGVDSSAIAALMKRMVSGPVKTFAVGYREAEFSELGYAAHVSRAIGTEHHEVVIGMEDFFEALPKLVWHEDEPIVWPSSVSLYFVSKLAAEQVKVVLTGEGSDELFAGYGRYRFYQINRRWMRPYLALPGAVRRMVRGAVAESPLLSATLRRKLQHSFLGRGESLEELYLDNFYSAFSGAEQAGLGVARSSSAYDGFLRHWDAGANRSLLARLLYTDQKTYLVELLMKQDQMSMACSIESRVPFLDHPFVEFASRVPESLKIRGEAGKHILKRAIEDLLPHDIIYRKKMGFPTPLRQWLMEERANPLFARLLRPHGFLAEYLNRSAIESLLERHKGGRLDATDRIWRLVNLQLWGETFLERRSGEIEPLLTEKAVGRT
jgi:asparagine synthase (glutamine-hydrolysing)